MLISISSCRLLCVHGVLLAAIAGARAGPAQPYGARPVGELMKMFDSVAAGRPERQEILISALNKSVPASAGNLQWARARLAATTVTEEKILLAKLLASMYRPHSRAAPELLIERDLKALIGSRDKRLATEAVFEYSRLGSPPDRYVVLQRAHAGKLLDDDGYYGELAHGLRFSTPQDQLAMLAELEVSRNDYAIEILAATFGERDTIDQLTPAARVRLFKYLSAHEPGFPQASDSFGVVDSARFEMWINAVASMESELAGKPYAQSVLQRLSRRDVDPRKILAVFGNPAGGARIIRGTADTRQLQQLQAHAQAYADSLPSNGLLRDAAAQFAAMMAAKRTEPQNIR